MNDFYSDQGALISKLFRSQEELPDFLKGANFIDEADLDELDDNAFADPSQRRFPVYDKAASLVSALYYEVGDEKDPQVERNIKRACGLFGLESEIRRLGELIADRKIAEKSKNQKTASANDSAWSVNFSDGHNEISISGEGKQAFLDSCESFISKRYETSHDLEFVKTAAGAFVDEALEKGGEFYAGLPEDMFKLAGYGYPDEETLEANIGARAMALSCDHKKRAFVEKVHELANAERDPEGLTKLASFLGRFDTEYGIKHLYGRKFDDPLRTVHNVSTRKAAALTAKVTVGDQSYYKAQLETGEAKKVARHVLGDDAFFEMFDEDKQFDSRKLASLDEPVAAAFNQLFSPGEVELDLVTA